MLERESRREKILEAKLREIKLKVKTQQRPDEDEDSGSLKQTASEIAINQARIDFMATIEKEISNSNPEKSTIIRLNFIKY